MTGRVEKDLEPTSFFLWSTDSVRWHANSNEGGADKMTNQTKEAPGKGSGEIDQIKFQMVMQEWKSDQNLSFGIAGGAVAAAVGATIWGIITAVTNYQIGWMAVGVGFLVGYAVRLSGKGIDKAFGVVGAVLSILGCVAGNLLTVCILISRHQHIPLLQLLSRLNPEIVIEIMKATFNPMDVLFYAIAVYEGYRFSFRRLSKEELERLK